MISVSKTFKLNNVIYMAILCYLPDIQVTESESVINLQNILDLTAFRLLCSLPQITYPTLDELTLIYKWGFDGSSGHAAFKQNFKNESFDDTDDSSILTTYNRKFYLPVDENSDRLYSFLIFINQHLNRLEADVGSIKNSI